MKNPYLIQRAKFRYEEGRKGLDSILELDYMGRAEFEFGALPTSLKRIRTALYAFSTFDYSFKSDPSKKVTVFCTELHKNKVGEILESLSKSEIQLKEYCDLKDYVSPTKLSSKYPSDFWWDIAQDWMFWKYSPEFEIKFKECIKG